MLLAPTLPMSFPTSQTRTGPRQRRQRSGIATRAEVARLQGQRRWLLTVWAVLGTLAVLCIPPLRGDSAMGWTLPFWLIAAPLINLAAVLWSQRLERLRRR